MGDEVRDGAMYATYIQTFEALDQNTYDDVYGGDNVFLSGGGYGE